MGRRRPDWLRRAVLLVAIVTTIVGSSGSFAFASDAPSDDETPPPTVLVIYGSFRGFVPYERFHERLESTIEREHHGHLDVHPEFVDAMVLRDEAYAKAVNEYLRQKYSRSNVEVVVGVGAMAARFAIAIRAAVFPDASLVYGYVDDKIADTIDFGPNSTGTTGDLDIGKTTAYALQLVPDAQHIAFVTGASDQERAWYDRAVREMREAGGSIDIIPLFGLTHDELIDRLEALPDHSIVIWGSFFRSGDGASYNLRDVLSEASAASKAPFFGLFEFDLGNGIVGGRLVDVGQLGEQTGRLVARVTNGEPAASIPRIHVSNNDAYADSRALRRWGIDARRLPAGTIVRFREPSTWEQYGSLLLVTGAVVLLQTLLIVGLVIQRSRRQRDRHTLAERLRFERLISELSARFVDLPDDQVDAALDESVREILTLYQADRVSLVEFANDVSSAAVRNAATRDGVEPLPTVIEAEEFGELLATVRAGTHIVFERPEDLPDTMRATRAAVLLRGLKSGVLVPLHTAGSALGFLAVATIVESRRWPADASLRLTVLADIFANAIVRTRSAQKLQESLALSGAVLASLNAQVCVVDRVGSIIAVNAAWKRAFGSTVGDDLPFLRPDGRNPAFESDPVPHADHKAGEIRSGIRAVLGGPQDAFSIEYRATAAGSDRWFLLTVERLRMAQGGAVLSHQNITARKRAEFEAEQRRQELAHVSRVSTLGELAAAIAHELNQPLTGVLTNAQAALRFLSLDRPNLDEVAEILRDIIEDDRRAGEVIRRLRSMLQTGAIEPADVDVNEVVADVLRLVGSDAVLRNVVVESQLAPGQLSVRGDRIQLQQVVLNLVVNAMDAMKDASESDRRVTVRTSAPDGETILISVADRGPGVDRDKLGRIFQPFYTTKTDGLGMGLSIARSIVEAHGGILWAVNNPDCGASFLCRLPPRAMRELEATAASA